MVPLWERCLAANTGARRTPRARGATFLETEVALYFFPEARFPAVDIKLIGIQRHNGHCRVSREDVIRRDIFRAQLEFAAPAFEAGRQAINGKT